MSLLKSAKISIYLFSWTTPLSICWKLLTTTTTKLKTWLWITTCSSPCQKISSKWNWESVSAQKATGFRQWVSLYDCFGSVFFSKFAMQLSVMFRLFGICYSMYLELENQNKKQENKNFLLKPKLWPFLVHFDGFLLVLKNLIKEQKREQIKKQRQIEG